LFVKSKRDAVVFFVLGFLLSWIASSVMLSVFQESAWKGYILNTLSPSSRTVPIAALKSDKNGTMGTVTVKAVLGEGDILLKANPFIETDLQDSANIAVEVAKRETGMRAPYNDLIISFNIGSKTIGGQSAGAAMAIGTMALLQNRTVKDDVAITGTIRSDGNIGGVEGIVQKTKAAALAGYKKMLIPRYQSAITLFEEVPLSGDGSVCFNESCYEFRVMNITEAAKDWGIELIEVYDIREVAEIMLE
jgi:predicted S18 family serine protease